MARGSIVTRTLNDGSKRYDCVFRVDGKQKWKSFERKKDAEGYLDKNSTDVREHTYRELIKGTFKEYADRWRKKNLIPQELKASTMSGYAYVLDRHIVPYFRSKAIAGIATADITDFRADMLKGGQPVHDDEGEAIPGKLSKPQSLKSVKNLLNLLNRVFSDAIEDGYLKVSPMPHRRRKADKATKADRKGRALQPDQVQRILEECEANKDEKREANPDLRIVVLIGLLAGLRRGEIFGLSWTDIDWEAGVIHVRQNLFWRHGKHHQLKEDEPSFVVYAPKTQTSIRDIDLSPTLKKELRTRFLESADKHGLIFQSGKGTPMDPHNVYERWFKPAVERAKKKADKEKDVAAGAALDGLRMHDLRHTFGSWKVAQGEDILYVSAQMGHARPSITADIYSHLLEKRRPTAAATTDTFLFGKAAVSD